MADMAEKIIKNILSALYQPFGFAILVGVLFMFVYMYAQEQGWKAILKKWKKQFKESSTFADCFYWRSIWR